eukprot:1145647-Pelagomonas_calceolata.AAC.5
MVKGVNHKNCKFLPLFPKTCAKGATLTGLQGRMPPVKTIDCLPVHKEKNFNLKFMKTHEKTVNGEWQTSKEPYERKGEIERGEGQRTGKPREQGNTALTLDQAWLGEHTSDEVAKMNLFQPSFN